MTDSPTIERREPKNAALRNFIAWVEKTEMYGKFTVTVKKGVVVGIEANQTYNLADFEGHRPADLT